MFRRGAIRTLDAGCGNGCLGFAARRLGNKVLCVSFDAHQVEKNREFYHCLGYSDMEFEVCNLYDLARLGRQFDQIICSETLEHITGDAEVIRIFAEILTDNGVLHLCCPYAPHPSNNLGRTNDPETGGHVRDGYTLETYKALLEPVGFTIVSHFGLGSNLLIRTDQVVRFVRDHFGHLAAAPFFLLFGWLAVLLDDRMDEPKAPYSLYVQATKRFNKPKGEQIR
jgi:2-polyprenyl-3-methyl-5-hydroxy-6-metoxy-1,4-benzoquinol methylase